MIKSFRHKGIQTKHAPRLHAQLTALHAAVQPEDMNAPGWKLHKLSGKNPKGQAVQDYWAVSVSGNWRLTFYFENKDAVLMDYQDYHQEKIMRMHNPAQPFRASSTALPASQRIWLCACVTH
ncbi:MAG: peptidase [Alcaligenaceae bacterium]|nr:peptidase [Alcaligenaceae bacterium]